MKFDQLNKNFIVGLLLGTYILSENSNIQIQAFKTKISFNQDQNQQQIYFAQSEPSTAVANVTAVPVAIFGLESMLPLDSKSDACRPQKERLKKISSLDVHSDTNLLNQDNQIQNQQSQLKSQQKLQIPSLSDLSTHSLQGPEYTEHSESHQPNQQSQLCSTKISKNSDPSLTSTDDSSTSEIQNKNQFIDPQKYISGINRNDHFGMSIDSDKMIKDFQSQYIDPLTKKINEQVNEQKKRAEEEQKEQEKKQAEKKKKDEQEAQKKKELEQQQKDQIQMNLLKNPQQQQINGMIEKSKFNQQNQNNIEIGLQAGSCSSKGLQYPKTHKDQYYGQKKQNQGYPLSRGSFYQNQYRPLQQECQNFIPQQLLYQQQQQQRYPSIAFRPQLSFVDKIQQQPQINFNPYNQIQYPVPAYQQQYTQQYPFQQINPQIDPIQNWQTSQFKQAPLQYFQGIDPSLQQSLPQQQQRNLWNQYYGNQNTIKSPFNQNLFSQDLQNRQFNIQQQNIQKDSSEKKISQASFD